MQVYLLFAVFSCLYMGCSLQEVTNLATQSSTDPQFSTGTQGIDWDTTIPSVQSSARNGRKEGHYQPRDSMDYTVFDNHWGPMLMQMQSPAYGARIQGSSQGVPNLYPFLQHTNTGPINWTEPAGPSDPVNAAFMPYPSVFFYPQPIPDERQSFMENSYSDEQLPLLGANEKQNLSASASEPSIYGPPKLRIEERQDEFPFPFVNFPPPNYFLRNRADVANRRNTVPSPISVPSGFYPAPPALTVNGLDVGPQVFPQVNVFVRPPFGDRESGLNSPIFPPRDISTTTEPTFSREISSISRSNPSQPIPPEVFPRAPLPANPFPFGFLPPNLPPPPPFIPPTGVIPPPRVPPQILPNGPVPSSENLIVSPFPQNIPSVPINLPPVPSPASPPVLNALPPRAAESIVESEGLEPDSEPLPDGVSNDVRHPYEFGFDMNDGKGTDQHRQESADETGVVTGSYGYRDPFGVYRLVNYIADKNGFRAFVKSNEPGVANPGSADVMVVAERPPQKVVADSLRSPNLDVVEVPDVAGDLIVEAGGVS